MPEGLCQWREADHLCRKHLTKAIEEDEQNPDLSKQEAIARATSRLREEIEGFHGAVENMFPEHDQFPLTKCDESQFAQGEDALATFLNKLEWGTNALTFLMFDIRTRLIEATVARDVEAQIPDPDDCLPFE